MALRDLFTNFFSIVTIEFAPQDAEGAIRRDFHFSVLPDYVNVRCAIQGVSKRDVVEVYGKTEDTPLFKIYHNQRQLLITTKYSFLTHANPLNKITDFEDKANIILYQYIGQRDPVLHKSAREVPLELIVERNFRWSF